MLKLETPKNLAMSMEMPNDLIQFDLLVKKPHCIYFLLLFFIGPFVINAQNDTEFPPGFVAHLNLHSGLATAPGTNFDVYVGGIQIVPQFTIIPYRLRAGLAAGGVFTNKEVNGLFGITTDLKLATINFEDKFGVASNLHLTFQHLWGTGDQKLIGGGLGFEALSLINIKLNVHRDYFHDNWWVSIGFGARLSKVKDGDEPFNE